MIAPHAAAPVKVCVVTCTGGRRELFTLCRRWVEHQTVKPDAWVVTDDVGDMRDLVPVHATYVRVPVWPEVYDKHPTPGAVWALANALDAVPKDHAVVIMEDDDYYYPQHIEKAVQQLKLHQIVQLRSAWRCHLPAQRIARELPAENEDPTIVQGLSSFRYESIPHVRDAVSVDPFHKLGIHYYEGDTCVSIKGVGYGLPGRTGATRKHIPKHRKTLIAQPDPDHAMFKVLLGEHADLYLALLS